MSFMEIERKFLVVSNEYRIASHSQSRIVQGFLNTDPHRTVRIRIYDNKGYLTIKGMSNRSGTSRMEWEFEIDPVKARELMSLSAEPLIEKTRYLVQVETYLFEVDEFEGASEGLIIAELELENENEDFPKPAWLGREVTGDPKYYNAQLSKKPFNQWQQ